jgi:hypothetical protein
MDKKIDGIKKINNDPEASLGRAGKSGKKYSRQIVLESIGEGEIKKTKGPLISDIRPSLKSQSLVSSAKKIFNKTQVADNFIDKKIIADNLKIDEEDRKSKQKRKGKTKKFSSPIRLKEQAREKTILDKNKDDVLRKQINAKLEEAKEEKLSFDDLLAYEKRSESEEATSQKIKKTQDKQEEKLKIKEKNLRIRKEKAEEDKKRKIKIEKAEEDKKNAIRKNIEKKKALKEKKREDFKNKIKEAKQNFKDDFNNFLNSIKTHLNNSFLLLKKRMRKALVLFAFFILIILVLYLSLFIVITKFDIDNKASRVFAKVFPLPAFFVEGGFVEYYSYIDIKASFKDKILNDQEIEFFAKREIASELIMNLLEKKYGISINRDLLEQDNFKSKLSEYIMQDSGINTVALKRIKKIDEMIKNGEDFIKVSNKYGDSLGKISLNNENKNDYTYSGDVMKLKDAEISGIVYAENGYYIFKCFRKENDSSDLSYVFIKGVNFDEYFNEAINSFKMMSLVD